MERPVTCEECSAAREVKDYRRFNPLCKFCGARYWRAVGKMRTGAALQKWRQHILDVWVELGHDAAEIQTLGMEKAVPFEPVTKGKT